jgi:hypothetical protein
VHTASQLDRAQFAIVIDGEPSTFDELLPNWQRHDRFGLVVDSPLGGVGASLLLQAAVTAFYAMDANRRGRVYPEVYVFHVGGRHGNFGWYDVFPPRKEVVVLDGPGALLDAINDRGITRLAVVDGPVGAMRHHHQEPATALDRIVSAFAYSPGGRVDNADVEIAALDSRLIENTRVTLHPEATGALRAKLNALVPPVRADEDAVAPIMHLPPQEIRDAIRQAREEISPNGLPVETYRRLPVLDALGMLRVQAPATARWSGAANATRYAAHG